MFELTRQKFSDTRHLARVSIPTLEEAENPDLNVGIFAKRTEGITVVGAREEPRL